MRARLARGRLRVRCDTCGRHYKTGRLFARPPFPCVIEGCAGQVRRETIAEQSQGHDAYAQFRADAREVFAIARAGHRAEMPATLINRPWKAGGTIVRP